MIDTEAALSIIVRIEVLIFIPANPSDLEPFEDLVNTVEVIPLSEEVVLSTILIRRKYKLKLPDAIIAAAAMVFGLTVVTRNEADFKKVQGLIVINPFTV